MERSAHKSSVESDWANVRNLLAMRLDNIGDVVMLGPALRAIKETLPRVHLTLMASPAGLQASPLLPWLDDIFTWRVLWQDLGRLAFDPAREWALIDELRERRFDAAVIFTSFSQSPHAPAFACCLAGIPLRLGESKESADGMLTSAAVSLPDHIHQAERNVHLIRAIGFNTDDTGLALKLDEYDRASAARLLASGGIGLQEPYLLLAPWASAEARTYDTGRFGVAVLDLARVTGWPVVVTGGGRDRDRGGDQLLDVLGTRAVNAIGRTSVRELAALVEGARLVLTNNTSALHFADALGTPVVVLYSGTDYESQWRARRVPNRLLRRPTTCSPCYAFTCPKHMECLDIPPQEIVAAALELLESRPNQWGQEE